MKKFAILLVLLLLAAVGANAEIVSQPPGSSGGGGSGTVTSVSVATANGFSGTVANPTTTPAITIIAGAITPTSVNGLTITTTTGVLTIANSKTLTDSNTLTFTGTDGSSVNFGTGGTVLYGNQSITLSGDVTGSGTTAITTTAVKVNGVAYGTSPSTNTVPVVTSSNTVTYETVPNAALANSAITFGATSQALGTTVTNLNAVNVGPTTAGTGAFTTLSANSTVTMTGLSSGTVVSNSYIGLNASNQLVLGSGGGGGGTVTLGTSAAATNPQRTSQAGTGFYSDTSNQVEVAINSAALVTWAAGTETLLSTTASTDPLIINSNVSYPNTKAGIDFQTRGSTAASIYATEVSGSNQFIINPGSIPLLIESATGNTIFFQSAGGGKDLAVITTDSHVDYIQANGGTTGNPGTATISGVGSDSNVYLKLLAKGTGTVQIASHKSYLGTAPAVSSCGTSPSIDANATDNSGTVTVGTVAAASCTVTFNVAYTNFVHCRVTSQSTIASFAYSYTKTAITVAGTSLVGDLFDYECDGQ